MYSCILCISLERILVKTKCFLDLAEIKNCFSSQPASFCRAAFFFFHYFLIGKVGARTKTNKLYSKKSCVTGIAFRKTKHLLITESYTDVVFNSPYLLGNIVWRITLFRTCIKIHQMLSSITYICLTFHLLIFWLKNCSLFLREGNNLYCYIPRLSLN